MCEIPSLTSDRLVLRGPIEADFDAVLAYATSDRATYTGGKTDDRFAVWRGFLGVLGHWALRGYGFFTVTLTDNTPIGRVGVINHIMWDEPELGWHLFDGYEGRGYATEAARMARDWVWQAHGLGPLISYIHPDNTPSRRLAQRLGATFERDGLLLDHPIEVWRHQRPGT